MRQPVSVNKAQQTVTESFLPKPTFLSIGEYVWFECKSYPMAAVCLSCYPNSQSTSNFRPTATGIKAINRSTL